MKCLHGIISALKWLNIKWLVLANEAFNKFYCRLDKSFNDLETMGSSYSRFLINEVSFARIHHPQLMFGI